MKSFNPSSTIYLCDVPWTNNYTDMLSFTKIEDQSNYFNSIIKKSYSNYVYLKKDSAIKVEGNIDDLIMYNYLFYQNPSTNKRYYCFITNMEYISENTTQIYFETDVWQTWGFQIEYKKCFVERCHVTDDSVGANTVPEGLETGEYICNAHVIDDHMSDTLNDLTYVVSMAVDMSTIDLAAKTISPAGMHKYNGIISGTMYYRYDFTGLISTVLEELTELNQLSAINGMFMAPKELAPYGSTAEKLNQIPESDTAQSYTNTIVKQTTLDGYTPRNNKLLCHPYNYLLVSNNQGTSEILHYEDFSTSSCNFKINMALTPGCSIRMTPLNFKGISENDDYAINMGKLPICSYNVDMYTNWLTQNSVNTPAGTITTDQVNIGSSVGGGMLNMLGSVLSLNPSGLLNSASSTFTNTFNAVLENKQHNMLSGISQGNLNSGDVCTSTGTNTYHFYKMSVRSEFAKIIDNYFDMFGYKVNRIQQLQVEGRPNWNYVKTINCNIGGAIPEQDLNKLKQLFNNGGTFWHNINTMYDYSQNNK